MSDTARVDWAPIVAAAPGGVAIMGIVNVTPDSFSDGGRLLDDDPSRPRVVAHARRLLAGGAGLLDVGGESTRPGASPVDPEEEARRVVPALHALGRAGLGVPLSVDTRRAAVADAALSVGATIVNDVSALRDDPELGAVVAERRAGVVLMHRLGASSATMQDAPRYDDVAGEVAAFLAERAAHAEALGIARERIAVDPGIGFGKTGAHNAALLAGLGRIVALGYPVLVGVSRKTFLGAITGRERPDERDAATAAAGLVAVRAGATLLRVHDAASQHDVLAVWRALGG